MKNVLVLLTINLFFCSIYSQKNEIGIMIGNPNIIGDIGKTNYIQPIPSSSFSLGLLYRYNLNPRQSVRLNLSYNKMNVNDNKAREDYRIRRGLEDKQTVMEAALLFEYYFFDINDETIRAISPYIFAGAGLYVYDKRTSYTITHSLYRDASGNTIIPPSTLPNYGEYFDSQETNSQTKSLGLAIPFGLGVKYKFSYNWLIMAEVGFRWTRNEYLDHNYADANIFNFNATDSQLSAEPYFDIMSQRNIDAINERQTGNLSTYDWYVVTSIGLAYTFGRPPCFCE